MSQRQAPANVIVFPSSKPNSRISKLNGVTCKMLPANSSSSLQLAQKAARLQAERPAVAALLEKLVDDFLAEVS